ncbi:MAG: hypothetical protein AB7K24_22730, partial [Gemmataceae bacterium]
SRLPTLHESARIRARSPRPSAGELCDSLASKIMRKARKSLLFAMRTACADFRGSVAADV